MAVSDFPVKSYLIKQCRSDQNKQVKISATPGLAPGTQYSFKDVLTDKVRDMVQYCAKVMQTKFRSVLSEKFTIFLENSR